MSSKQDEQPGPYPAGPGALLRRARESHRLSIADVSYAIKLTPRQIEAIETGDFASLPGQTFARGFVRNYARYLQIDPEPLVLMVEEQMGQARVDLSPVSNASAPMPAAASGVPGPLIGLVILAVAALGVIVYFERVRPEQATSIAPATLPPAVRQAGSVVAETGEAGSAAPAAGETAPAGSSTQSAPSAADAANATAVAGSGGPVVASSGAAPAPESQAATSPAIEPAAPTEPATKGLRRLAFRFDAESWVQVKDSAGNVLTIGTNKAGTSRLVEGQPPLSVIVGNSEFVRLEADGKPVDLGKLSDVGVARFNLE